MQLPIFKDGAKELRKKSIAIEKGKVDHDLVGNMIETMYSSHGIGLAAPQVGKNIRLIVTDWTSEHTMPLVWINPSIIKHSKKKECGKEGCLSVPGFEGDVDRFVSIVVRFETLAGEVMELELEDYAARILQHEIDHLDGILYIDKVKKKTLVKISQSSSV